MSTIIDNEGNVTIDADSVLLADLDLTERTRIVLAGNGLTTAAQIEKMGFFALERLPRIGRKTAREIVLALHEDAGISVTCCGR